MANKVCELTKIIVNDGVTLYHGYVECSETECKVYVSDDPVNEEAKNKPFLLHNRVEFARVEKTMKADEKAKNKCFVSEEAMSDYLTI